MPALRHSTTTDNPNVSLSPAASHAAMPHLGSSEFQMLNHNSYVPLRPHAVEHTPIVARQNFLSVPRSAFSETMSPFSAPPSMFHAENPYSSFHTPEMMTKTNLGVIPLVSPVASPLPTFGAQESRVAASGHSQTKNVKALSACKQRQTARKKASVKKISPSYARPRYHGPSPVSFQVLHVASGVQPLAPKPPQTPHEMSMMIQKFMLLEEKARGLEKENADMWKRLAMLEDSIERKTPPAMPL